MAHDLDPIDHNIVRMLAGDARISYAELGRKVGLSPSAVAERIHHAFPEKICVFWERLVEFHKELLLDKRANLVFGFHIVSAHRQPHPLE